MMVHPLVICSFVNTIIATHEVFNQYPPGGRLKRCAKEAQVERKTVLLRRTRRATEGHVRAE